MVLSGGAIVSSQALMARYAGAVGSADLLPGAGGGATEKKSDIKGPLNILLVGIDPRSDEQTPLSDSIIVAHVPKSMDQVYMFSVPRDLVVDIPAFEKTGFKGGRSKINAAMGYGSAVGNGKHDVVQGFDLLAKTVLQLTGLKEFDAGSIINFNGFKAIVEAMGGVTMTIDQNVKSEHLQPDGKPRPRLSRCADNSCEHPYYGPQAEYKKGTYHLKAWQALDYVRQRYGLPKGDYDRQRHQQQFVKAMAKQALGKDVITNPAKLDRVLKAAGKALIFDGNGKSVIDWGLALRDIRADDIVSIKLPGSSIIQNGQYRGEELPASSADFFAALGQDQLPAFLFEHPEYVNKSQ
jgi:polyisoprenyl-teichoic acid--peptidoglycan teichoic acid transferase